MSEWLRRLIRNHLGFARAGSNPVIVDFCPIYASFAILSCVFILPLILLSTTSHGNYVNVVGIVILSVPINRSESEEAKGTRTPSASAWGCLDNTNSESESRCLTGEGGRYRIFYI